MFHRIKEKREVDRQKNAKQKISDDLFEAVTNRDLDKVIKIVNEHGNDPEIINAAKTNHLLRKNKKHGVPVLIHAVRAGDAAIVNALLQSPCININMRDEETQPELASALQHNNALLAAVNNKKIEIVEILAARKDVNVNAVAQGGESPLICAVENFPAAVPVLLRIEGVNLNAKNIHGKTALHLACLRRNPLNPVLPRYLTELLNHDATSLDVTDNDGWTPLMYAIKRSDYTLIYLLLDAGADVSIKNKSGLTAMDIARQYAFNQSFIFHLQSRIKATPHSSAASLRM